MAFGVNDIEVTTDQKNFFGRYDLVIANRGLDLDENVVKNILETLLPTHFKNRRDINTLKGIFEGNQEILNKVKLIRPDINHKIVENNAFHLVEFKKGFVFGEPIQYIQRQQADVEELDLLNAYMTDNNKSSEDKDLGEDLYVSGVAYRIALPEPDPDLPFIIKNLDNRDTFVVYNNTIKKEKLLAGCMFQLDEDLWEVMVYTKYKVMYFHFKGNPNHANHVSQTKTKVQFVRQEKNPMKRIPIVEYKLNKSKIGIIELVLGSLNALNFITSSDLDDIEQFIQSFLVFINQTVEEEELRKLMDIGALQINSTGKFGADVKLLTNKISHSETKVLYDRIYNNMLTIAGVPRMSDKGSGGDTGQARMLGEGWTMADARAVQDELAFKISERELISIVLDICKNKGSVKINKLLPREVEIKFTRNRSDNMLVKTQSLVNLMTAQVSPEIAFNTVGLFSDPHEAVLLSKSHFGESFWKTILEIPSETDDVDNQEDVGKEKLDNTEE